jgi:hypothetical protein
MLYHPLVQSLCPAEASQALTAMMYTHRQDPSLAPPQCRLPGVELGAHPLTSQHLHDTFRVGAVGDDLGVRMAIKKDTCKCTPTSDRPTSGGDSSTSHGYALHTQCHVHTRCRWVGAQATARACAPPLPPPGPGKSCCRSGCSPVCCASEHTHHGTASCSGDAASSQLGAHASCAPLSARAGDVNCQLRDVLHLVDRGGSGVILYGGAY